MPERLVRLPQGRIPAALAIRFGAAAVAVLAMIAALFLGSELMEALARQPAVAVNAVRIQAALRHVLELTSDLESDRRGYQLDPRPHMAAAVRHSSARVSKALNAARGVIGSDQWFLAQVDSAERAIEEWRLRALPPGSLAGGARGVAMDEELLGVARRALGRAEMRARQTHARAEERRADALERAKDLWLTLTVLALASILLLGDAAWRWQLRVRRAVGDIRLMLETLPLALLSLDAGGKVLRASGKAAEAFGLPRDQLEGRMLSDVVAGSGRADVERAIGEALAGTRVELEVLAPSRDGESRVLAMTLADLPGSPRGAGPAVSVVVRDITAERALETLVAQADRLAAVGSLVAGVAHELNNPLNAIAALASLVERAKLTDEDRRALDMVAEEAQRAGRIVRNLLDFSRQHSHEHEPTSVAEVLDRALALRRYNLRRSGTIVDTDVDQKLPLVLADPQELQQVFLNLIVNAEQALEGLLQRRILVTAKAVTPDRIVVRFEDSGAGIPEDRRELIFEPFYTTKPKGVGTGLGLPLSRGIVTELGGELKVSRSSQLGGACFSVELPALTGIIAADASDPRRVSTVGPAVAPPGAHVLLADDEVGNRTAVTRFLRRLGYRVTAVENGREALDACERYRDLSCVLCDVHMPVLDGFGLLDWLSRHRPELTGRIAMLTGDTVGDASVAALRSRGCVVLHKPFELAQLKEVVEQLVRSQALG